MKIQNIAFILLFLFPVFFIYGQPSWERVTPIPQENTINDIVRIPGTDKLIAVGEGSTVMISTNNGDSWNTFTNPAGMDNHYKCNGVYFINSTDGFIYGGQETILRTTDGGINWDLVYSGNSIYSWQFINEIEFINETTGFAIADNGQLLKSVNTGESWEIIESGVSTNLNVIEISDDNTGFIFTNTDEYLKTYNGGESWSVENLQTPISGLYIQDVYFTTETTGFAIGTKQIQKSNHGQIYKTTDIGNTWVEVYSDENGWYWPEAIDFIDENTGMVSFNTIMYGCINYLTNDGGETWVETPMIWLMQPPYKTLCYYDENNAILSGNQGTICYSGNGGYTWDIHSERTFVGEILQLLFTNNEIAYASAAGGSGGVATYDIYKTYDGGENWSLIKYFMQLGTFHFLNEDLGFAAINEPNLTIYKTTNGGQGWDMIELDNFNFEPRCIQFHDELNGIICGENIIIKTSDGGYNWTEINTGFSTSYTDIEYKNENEVYICGNSLIIISTDGGTTWSNYSFGSNLHLTDIYLKDNNTIFITGRDTIVKSYDNGETWSGAIINNQNMIDFQSIHFPTSDIGYAVGHGQYETIVKTIDGGETWNVINSKSTSGLNAVHFIDENIGLVIGENGIVLKTTTGGITGFEELDPVSSNSLFEVFPNPFSDNISISINAEIQNQLLVSIYDLSGKLILEKTFPNKINELNLNLSGLENGIYLCNVKFDGRIVSRKIVKSN